MRAALPSPSASPRTTAGASLKVAGTEMQELSESALLAALFSGSEADAAEVLQAVGGLAGLVGISAQELLAVGLRPALAATVLATLELAARWLGAKGPRMEPLRDLGATARYLWLRYSVRGQEVFGAMFLDRRRRLMLEKEYFRGSIDRVAVAPTPILRTALGISAARVLLFHTHPSGNPKPSPDDLMETRRFVEAAELVGVETVDHLVLAGPGAWTSMRARMGSWGRC